MEATGYDRDKSKLFAHYSQSRSANEKIRVEWKDVNYSILVKDAAKSTLLVPAYKNKRILRGLNGSVSSGELLAIMGPTGESSVASLLTCVQRTITVMIPQVVERLVF